MNKEEKQSKHWEEYLESLRKKKVSPKKAKPHLSDCVRAPQEDDDGYDPYSDRIETPRFFEEHPWD